MNKRKLVTVVAIVGVAAMMTTSFPTAQVKADHCHPEHTKKAATPPTPAKPARRPARTRVSNPARQRTAKTRVPGTHSTPVSTGVSSLPRAFAQAGHGGHMGGMNMKQPAMAAVLSLESIHAKHVPMVVMSIDKAKKALASGDKRAVLAELNKAQEMLVAIRAALGTHVKPQFANNLCPLMGSPINPAKVTKNLIRDY